MPGNIVELRKKNETMEMFFQRIKAEYHLMDGKDDDGIVNVMKTISFDKFPNRKIFEGVGMGEDRYPTQLSLFRIWLMGEKNMSAEKAFVYDTTDPDHMTYVREFSKFLYENRVRNNVRDMPKLSDEKIEEHAVNIYKMLQKATEKLKELKLPDIDYNNPEEFRKHKDLLLNISGMGVDFSQEIASFTKNLPNGVKYATKVFGGLSGYSKMMSDWNDVTEIGKVIDNCYGTRSYNNPDAEQYKLLVTTAVGRFQIKELGRRIRGKKLSEYSTEKRKDLKNDLISNRFANDMEGQLDKDSVDPQIYIDYISGKNNKFEKEYNKRAEKVSEKALLNVNQVSCETAQNFGVALETRGNVSAETRGLFEGNPAPEELLRRMKETKDGKKVEEMINYSFYKLEESLENSSKLQMAAGIEGLDRIRVDGKSPKELWGPKYAALPNAEDRDMMIKAELFREIYHGNSKIVAENYSISKDNKMVKSGNFALSYTEKELQGYQSFFAEVDKLHEYFSEIKDVFAQYQKNPEANFEEGAVEGSTLYQNMIKALNRCIDQSDINGIGTKDGLMKAIQSYQKAAEKYYNERKDGTFGNGPRSDKGQIRLGLAENAMNNLMERYDTLNILSKGLGMELGKYERDIHKNFKNIRNNIINKVSLRGGNLSRNDFTIEAVRTKPFYENNLKAEDMAAARNKDYFNNPLYKSLKTLNPSTYMSKWCKAVEGAEKLEQTAARNIARAESAAGNLGKYVHLYDIGMPEGDADKVSNRRYVEVITDKILSDKKLTNLRIGIAANKNNMDIFKKYVKAYVEKHPVPDDVEQINQSIASGQLVKDVLGDYSFAIKKAPAKTKQAEHKAQKNK